MGNVLLKFPRFPAIAFIPFADEKDGFCCEYFEFISTNIEEDLGAICFP
jgi:hypothetical protein